MNVVPYVSLLTGALSKFLLLLSFLPIFSCLKPDLAFKDHLQSHFWSLLTIVTSLVFGPVLNYILPYPVSSCRLFLIPLSEFGLLTDLSYFCTPYSTQHSRGQMPFPLKLNKPLQMRLCKYLKTLLLISFGTVFGIK